MESRAEKEWTMSHTEHVESPHPFAKERSWARRLLMHRERARVRDLLSHEEYEQVEGRLTKGSEGSVSW